MAEGVLPMHKLGLIINGSKVDVLVLLQLGIHIKGEW